MSEFFKNNPIALRHCLLFEVLQRNLIEDAYSKFCTTLGEDFMEYKEFEFWYHRFSDGNYDMNFERERNEDEKIYELSDMPLDIMEKIVEHLDIIDRSALARTSRSLQKFVEGQKLFHDNLTFESHLENSHSQMLFGEEPKIVYIQNYYDCTKHFVTSGECMMSVTHSEQAILDLKNIFKQPKLHLDTFNINCRMDDDGFDHEKRREIEETLNETINELKAALTFTHQLNVRKFILEANTLKPLSKILPCFQPGYLTTIDASCFQDCDDSLMEEVVEMEQWKQAKYFAMIDHQFLAPRHHLYHFKEFSIHVEKLTVEDIREMKENLFKSPVLERCTINVLRNIDIPVIRKEFGDAVAGFRNTYHYPIPNSTDYFKIRLSSQKINITRKKI